ncbi:hypothetical protein IE81DRAFT_348651 [Ceraceosorus guamensis]|uniref:K Homology domain-containing protein n=1 Tax=Ceraceosorus guamensis TaxID=1522189 RepID=A0A316VUE1_9BASI|nr:hypothetical protein IE81DRAFT_348651 [Ceraceosorus guamensis]PWN41112.1 hypothetical protein IE81DRAFT_348651 [Ceraceosorus guamensis]
MAATEHHTSSPQPDAAAAVSASEANANAVSTNGNGGDAAPGAEAASSPSKASGGAAAPPDPNAPLTVRALVSTKEAGVIIGKGGQNVADLREQTGVKAGVSKVVQGVHDRVLSVTGTAYAFIAKTILDNPVTAAAAPGESTTPTTGTLTSIRLLISHNLMGTVIGRQGLKIKHIQDISGARMVASKEMLPQSTERIVEVQGTTEAIRVAIQEISQCLLEDWERGQGTVLYHPGQADGAGVLAAGGAGGLQPQTGGRRTSGAYLAGAMSSMTLGAGGSHISAFGAPTGGRRTSQGANGDSRKAAPVALDAAAIAAAGGAAVTPGGGLLTGAPISLAPAVTVDPANMRTQNISIPSDMVGCIIGKGGSKITEIRRLSGSRISIAKVPHDDTGERMFTIQGTPEANEKALFLLYNQLESEKERRTQTVPEEDIDAANAANKKDETTTA